jgi:hypothetical protein
MPHELPIWGAVYVAQLRLWHMASDVRGSLTPDLTALIRRRRPAHDPSYISPWHPQGRRRCMRALKTRGLRSGLLPVRRRRFPEGAGEPRLDRRGGRPPTRDFNLEIRRASELDAEALDALLSTPPMLAERRSSCCATWTS